MRADSWPGRIVAALAGPADDPAPLPSRGIRADSWPGQLIAALARTPVGEKEPVRQPLTDLSALGRKVVDEHLRRLLDQPEGDPETLDEVLANARRQAEQITGDAVARAESLERDAQERHQQAMGMILQQKEELERRVDDLRMFEREYRTRLQAYLQGRLRDLETGGLPLDVATGPRPDQIASAVAADVISLRIRALSLARLLHPDADSPPNLAGASELARNLARDLATASRLARSGDLNLALALNGASSLAGASALALARVSTDDLDLNLEFALAIARDFVSSLVDELDAPQVDASGADLSNIEIGNIDALDGVIWTRETIWPFEVSAQVEMRSAEIRPGVFQIRTGNARDRDLVYLG